jgi:hypothetical protein
MKKINLIFICAASLLSSLQFYILPANAGEKPTPLASSISVVNPKKQPPPLPPYEPSGLRIEYKIILSSAIKNAVTVYDPDFVLWEQSDYRAENIRTYQFSLQSTPSAVIGDFNGDGKTDAVLAGRNTRGAAVLAIMSSSTALYNVIPIHKGGRFDNFKQRGDSIPKIAFDILSFQPKGKTYKKGDKYVRTLILPSNGIKNETLKVYHPKWYSNGTIYWWDDSKKKFIAKDL